MSISVILQSLHTLKRVLIEAKRRVPEVANLTAPSRLASPGLV